MNSGAYDRGWAELAGDDAPPALTHQQLLDKAAKALSLLQDALSAAQKIIADNSGTWAQLKAKVTGVDLDAAKNQVATLEKGVARMEGVQAGFDDNTPVAKLKDFILTCQQLADLSVLKDVTARNDLGTLAKEVSAATVADVAKEVKGASETVASSLWGSLPWWGKVLAVGVPSAAVFLGIRSRIERWGE